MKREDIIRMRREADKFADEICFSEIERTCENMELVRDEHFAKLVAAKEREDIARIDWHNLLREDGWVTNGQASAYSEKIEAAISARGEA